MILSYDSYNEVIQQQDQQKLDMGKMQEWIKETNEKMDAIFQKFLT